MRPQQPPPVERSVAGVAGGRAMNSSVGHGDDRHQNTVGRPGSTHRYRRSARALPPPTGRRIVEPPPRRAPDAPLQSDDPWTTRRPERRDPQATGPRRHVLANGTNSSVREVDGVVADECGEVDHHEHHGERPESTVQVRDPRRQAGRRSTLVDASSPHTIVITRARRRPCRSTGTRTTRSADSRRYLHRVDDGVRAEGHGRPSAVVTIAAASEPRSVSAVRTPS